MIQFSAAESWGQFATLVMALVVFLLIRRDIRREREGAIK